MRPKKDSNATASVKGLQAKFSYPNPDPKSGQESEPDPDPKHDQEPDPDP